MLGLLRRALDGDGDCFLVCEDDVIFNRHLRHNLARWAPLRAGRVRLASLYNPGVTALGREPQAVAADPETALGAQGRLYSRGCAEHVVREFRASAWHQDVAVARLGAELGPVLYHAPSLVQHAGVASVWGGPWHEARDFAPDWRADDAEG